MREVFFIRQNKEKWLEIEQVIDGKIKKNPDDLSSLYINLVNDLSFSQTYYPKSNTTIYLNHLSSQIFQKIYKTKRIDKTGFYISSKRRFLFWCMKIINSCFMPFVFS